MDILYLSTERQLLEDAKAIVDVAAQRARTTVPQVLQTWWEQPAIDCAPWVQGEDLCFQK